jgi:hypothetical protein
MNKLEKSDACKSIRFFIVENNFHLYLKKRPPQYFEGILMDFCL